MRLVLASASPARLSVLRSAGIEPVVRVSGVDEHAVTSRLPRADPTELVTALAEAKAEAVRSLVAAEIPDAVIVGCDSMLRANGEFVGKPEDADTAAARWRRMAGQTGALLTGHAVIRLADGKAHGRTSGHRATAVRFAEPSERELATYLATEEPLRLAGGFTLDGYGGWFVEGVDGDPSSVIGISLPLTRQLLADVGVGVVDLWNPA